MAESKTPHIDSTTAFDAFDESLKWFKPFLEPVDELERIARNKPSPKIPDGLPRITDGTMAAIIQEDPKRIVQTTPTGLVKSIDHPEYSKPGDIVLRQELIPRYNRMGTMIQKSWNMIGKAKTVGRATSYTFLTTTANEIHTDFIIPYVKDIIDEKGKVYAPDCNVRFMRAWYTKRDIKAIIRTEEARQKRDKNYKSDWNLKLLAEWLEAGASAKPADQQTPAEREKSADAGGFEMIHAFQEGINAEFYSFAPRFKDGKEVLRVKVNSDPRGKIPLDDLYNNVDLSNPLGRGQVELSGGVQNLMDQQMQMFQYMSLMEMAPPLKVFGNVDPRRLPMKPQAIWKMGTGQNNNVEPFNISNFALQNYTPNAQFLQSKIYQLNNSQDSSIPADSGSVGQSKTSAGVNQQQARLGVSDNYVRKQYEGWFEAQSETSLNLYFAEEKRTKVISLDKDDRLELEKTAAKKFINKEGKLELKFADIKDVAFSFQVNAGSSEVKEDSENMDKLLQVYEMASANPNPEIQAKVPELFKIIVKETGVEGVDELFPEDETDENGQPINQNAPQAGQQPQMTPEMVQQMVMETVGQAMEQMKAQEQPKENPTLQLIKALGLKYTDLPEDARAIVREHTGLGGESADPVQEKHDLEKLSALQSAEEFERGPEEKEAERQFQAQQSERQAQASQLQSAESQSQSQPTEQPDSLSPEEQEIVEALTMRGFSEDDSEQAIVMLRQGMSLEEVIPTIGAKYAGQEAM